MDRFRYASYGQDIIFGPGSLSGLSAAVDALKCRRVLLCAGHTMRSAGYLAAVETALGERLVAVVDRVLPHVQDTQLTGLLALAREQEVDAVMGMGGGSPIGMAKAVASSLAAVPSVPVIAIPSTYAGSEMTPVYGVTHTDRLPPRKVTVSDPAIVPRLVLYDPELTFELSPEMTVSTGINALAHCIEALYSKTRNPLSTAAATAGVRHIFQALLRCYLNGHDLESRTEMLLGSHLSGLALASVSMGLHHGLCHVLGGSANLPHGIANCIILPHAIRFNAETCASQLLPAADAIGLPVNGSLSTAVVAQLDQEIGHLIGRMNLPRRLRDAGVGLKETDLPALAQLAFQNRSVQNNPRPIENVAQLEQLLREAW